MKQNFARSIEDIISISTTTTTTIATMSNDPELLKKLIEDDDYEDVETQKNYVPVIVTGVAVANSSSPKSKNKTASRVVARRRGCPCWCKCIAIIMGIFAVFVVLTLGLTYTWLKDVVEHLTIETDSPKKFPIVIMSDLQFQHVKERVTLFADELVGGISSDLQDLVVTQDEINGIIGHSDYLRGNMMITLHDNRVEEEYSLPMDILGFGDRYFDGKDYLALGGATTDKKKNTIEMKIETAATHEDWFDGPLLFAQLQYFFTKNNQDEGDGVLELFLEKGSFFGQVAPQEVIDEHENLLEDLYDLDPDDDQVEYILDAVKGIKSVSIEEGKIVIKPQRTTQN